jgi:hypothetical protein
MQEQTAHDSGPRANITTKNQIYDKIKNRVGFMI